jgi:molybdopterin molybdotransferase
VGLAAAMNRPALPVRRRPRVALLATGDELIAPGARPRADQIVSSNATALGATAERLGAEANDLGIVGDDLGLLDRAIARAAGADILVTLGGASVGEHDLVREALTRRGMKLAFWKIAMRPGKPLMFGRLARQRVLGLPGNPVSALVCTRVFLEPLIRALLGLPAEEASQTVRLATAVRANDSRQDYLRATLVREADGTLLATPFARQDSSMLRTLAQADCLIVRPPFAEALPAGAPVPILRLDS